MFEMVLISGKGGTGKTSLAGAFAQLASNHVICDLDVDAPDLHLLLRPELVREEEFRSGYLAVIDPERCEACGLCLEKCRFGAIIRTDNGFAVQALRCEGCKVCVHFCPAQAIEFKEKVSGRWYRSQTRFGPFVHAQLFPGEENSGRLVALLRREAKELAQAEGKDLVLYDGAPGIGCPVISSLSGVKLAVVVTEPTVSGRHDLERVAELCAHFQAPVGVIINKSDLSAAGTRDIEEICRQRRLELLARLPFEPEITQAMIRGLVITEHLKNGLAGMIQEAWGRVLKMVRTVAEN